jgi:hypothetical protein
MSNPRFRISNVSKKVLYCLHPSVGHQGYPFSAYLEQVAVRRRQRLIAKPIDLFWGDPGGPQGFTDIGQDGEFGGTRASHECPDTSS